MMLKKKTYKKRSDLEKLTKDLISVCPEWCSLIIKFNDNILSPREWEGILGLRYSSEYSINAIDRFIKKGIFTYIENDKLLYIDEHCDPLCEKEIKTIYLDPFKSVFVVEFKY